MGRNCPHAGAVYRSTGNESSRNARVYRHPGGEFIRGEREDIDGNGGSDYCIQFSMKVAFDTGDLVGRE